MKLGWNVVLTLAGVGFAWTTAPLMAQNNQANYPAVGQTQQQYATAPVINQRYATAPVANQQVAQWQPAVAPQNGVRTQVGAQQVNHQLPVYGAQQPVPVQQQYRPVQQVQVGQNGFPQYPVQQVPQQYRPVGHPAQYGGPVQQQPVAVTPQQTSLQPQIANSPWNNNAQSVAPVPSRSGYPQRYAATVQPVAPQQQIPKSVVPQQSVSPVSGFNNSVAQQQTTAVIEPVQNIEPVSACNNDSCCDIEPLCESFDECCSTECCEPIGCCEPCCGPIFYAGAAAVWIKPHFQDNTAIVLDPPPNDNIVIPFNYDWEVSPRVWLGYEAPDGHGFRFSYWHFDEDLASEALEVQATQLAVAQVYGANGILTRNAFAGPGEWISAEHSMKLQTADFEFTSHHEYCTHEIVFGAGLRYAKMDQEYNAIAWTGGLGGTLDEQVRNRTGFEGFGPTVSIDWTRPCSDNGLSFYTNARGSILFGDVYQDVYEVKNAGADIGNDNYEGDDSLAIGELGLGLQYSILGGYGCEFIFRTGYEGQLWLDAGGPIRNQGDMALHGLSFGVGIYH